jgi:ABC-type multidrug transport system fused ATPase/permease subunit
VQLWIRCFGVVVGFTWTAARREVALNLLSGVVIALFVPVSAFGTKLFVDAGLARNSPVLIFTAVGLGGWIGLNLLVTLFYLDLLYTVAEKTGAAVDRRLMALLAGVPTLTHHEHPDFLRELDLLRDEQGSIAWAASAVAGLVRVAVGVGATLILLARLDPRLLVLPLLGLVSIWTGRQAQRLHEHAAESTVETERLRRRLFETATSAVAAKEIRLFDLAGSLRRRHHTAATTVLRARNRADWLALCWELGTALLLTAGYVGALAVVLQRALSGLLSPGDLVLTIGLAAGLSFVAEAAGAYVTRLLAILRVARRYLWLEDYAARVAPRDGPEASVPAKLEHGIELQNVSFTYSGAATPSLVDVSLALPAGAVVALVGENGAGKTTLVKLLCRFYEPTQGKILVDGVDLRHLPIADWRGRVRVGFQDFQQFELRVRETVGVGDIARITDRDAVGAALDQADTGAIVSGLPDGLETQLGRAWDGAELSIGQWQKLALARAAMRHNPLLVIFDEPTAALDAPTEHALFERVAAVARVGGSAGWVTVLVTHRFSTVRVADLIVVLDRGRVAELGSHQQLLAAGGLYAELYELQARTYRS